MGLIFLLGNVRLTVGILACISSSKFTRSGVDIHDEGLLVPIPSLELFCFSLLSVDKFVLDVQVLLLFPSLNAAQIKKVS